MRVLVVSTLFPPNFTSGGTLQPQRMVKGLRHLGHEAEVFAGWCGDRPEYESWRETDETGFAVNWIATTAFHSMQDDRSWWNPRATREFERVLDRFRPDVVHFHCIQGLGAGLVRAATERGLRTVVTMHDFWWFCRRLFLVDAELQRCPVVADAGVCPCARGVDREAERRRRLHDILLDVDLVLVPSESMRGLVVANGVPPDRVEVNENSIPDEDIIALGGVAAKRTAPPADGAVRFLFAGGNDPLKGGPLLLDAVVSGALGQSGWRLTTLGLQQPHAPEVRHALGALPVRMLDAVSPEQMRTLFADHDVLVLPSIMRESHSLVTREALAAGLVVIAADSHGPLEVIEHERNGLVVQPGSVQQLAAAMRRLVDDRALLDRLARRASSSDSAVAESVQVAELARFLSGAHRPRTHGVVRHVVVLAGIDGAPLRYRARLPAEALGLHGVSTEVLHYRDPSLLDHCLCADAVIAYRVPATVELVGQFETIRAAGIPIVFDIDDLIIDPSTVGEIPALRIIDKARHDQFINGIYRYRTTLELCDAFIGSTPKLVEAAAQMTGRPAHLFANGVGLELARLSDVEVRRPRRPGPLRFGYFSGTDTHDLDWAMIEPAVIEVLRRRPDVELWIGGLLEVSPALDRYRRRIRRFPFVAGHLLPRRLRDLDVNLAPLVMGGSFNESKSAIKWLEAALCLTPTIASPTQPFTAVIDEGVTGYLAASTEQWTDRIISLLDDAELRHSIAVRARDRAMEDLSPWTQGARYLDILESVVAAGVVEDRSSEWKPVVISEPPAPVRFEPYPYQGPVVDDGLPPEFGPMSRLPRSFLGVDLDRFWYSRWVLSVRSGPVARIRHLVLRR